MVDPYGSEIPPNLPTLEPIPDAFALLKAFRHRWFSATVLGLIFGALAAAATYNVLPESLNPLTANAKVFVRTDKAWFPAPDYTFKANQIEAIKLRSTLSQALDNDEVKNSGFVGSSREKAIMALEKQLRVDVASGSDYIEVSLSGYNGAQTAAVVNAVVDAYLANFEKQERKRRQDRYDTSAKAYDEQIRKMEEKWIEIARLKKGIVIDGVPIDYEHQETLDAYNSLKRRLAEITGSLERMRLELAYRESKADQPLKEIKVPEYLFNERFNQHPQVVPLLKRKSNLEAVLEGYGNIARTGPDAPEIIRSAVNSYKKQLDQVEAQLKNLRDQLKTDIERRILSETKSGPTTLEKLKEDIELQKREQDLLKARFEDEAKKVEKLFGRDGNVQYNKYKLEVDQIQEVAKQLALQKQIASLELESPMQVVLTQRAVEPDAKSSGRQTRTVMLVGVCSFGFVVFLVSWFEFRSRRIHSSDEVVAGLGLRLLGTFPSLPAKVRRDPMILESYGDTVLVNRVTESIDGIRTMLMHESRNAPVRVILVTSGVGGEGKTTLSTHLALSFARGGRKTLLVDCDLLRPTANQVLKAPLEPGFSEVLRGEIELSQAIHATAEPGLSILPAGQYDRLVSQVLAKGGAQAIFERLREDYEYVIVDSCPVLSVANTLLIAQCVDAAILSVLRDVSQAPRVHAAFQRLVVLGIRVMGAIFNRAHGEAYGYYSYYGYGYHNVRTKKSKNPEQPAQENPEPPAQA